MQMRKARSKESSKPASTRCLRNPFGLSFGTSAPTHTTGPSTFRLRALLRSSSCLYALSSRCLASPHSMLAVSIRTAVKVRNVFALAPQASQAGARKAAVFAKRIMCSNLYACLCPLEIGDLESRKSRVHKNVSVGGRSSPYSRAQPQDVDSALHIHRHTSLVKILGSEWNEGVGVARPCRGL